MALELDQSSYADLDGTIYYDLTGKTGTKAQINGALFLTEQPVASAGAGLIQTFVRVQDGGNDSSP